MRTILAVVLFMAALAGGFFFYQYQQYENFKASPIVVAEPRTIVIEKGFRWKQAAARLADAGVISNARFFDFLIRQKGWERSLKTGEYEFSGSLRPEEVAEMIVKGKVKLYTLTIPEGYNKFDVDRLLRSTTWLAENDRFLALCDSKKDIEKLGVGEASTCEGLLFPSTYRFPKGTTLPALFVAMDTQMQQILKKYRDKIKASGLSDYQLLTMASVIEKETGDREEQPRIASVFFNRLKKGMRLQSDPTVIYGFLPDFDGNLTRKQLETDHPYNTYTRAELPTGPICFPGETAISAVLNPDKSDLLYFVATGGGRHYFSKTLEEHNAAVDHYQVKGLKTPFSWKKQ